MNSLYQQLNPQMVNNMPFANPQIAQIKQMMNTMKMMKNPTAFIQSNPQMQQAIQLANSLGNNPKEAFYALAKQKGVNPEDILNQLK